VPRLVKQGFKGQIYCTPPTLELAELLLKDSAHLQKEDAGYLNRKGYTKHAPALPLYDEADVEEAMRLFVELPYGQEREVAPGLRFSYVDAGHILGAASVDVHLRTDGRSTRVLFSGDVGRFDAVLVKDPQLASDADYVVIESTYGNRLHKDIAASEDELVEVIKDTVKRGGKVLIPAFSVGRTQEIVYALNQLEHQGRIPRLPVYVDSPLSTAVTKVFEKHAECFDTETAAFLKANGNPFGFRNLTYVTTREESMKLNDITEPIIIIASSGMCEAGRILHHLRNNIENEKNTIIIVGFQAEHTLGRRIVERRPQVKIFGLQHDLHARVVTIGAFSAHADQKDLVEHARALGAVKRFFIVHGEPEGTAGLKAALGDVGLEGYIPAQGEAVELDPVGGTARRDGA
jgi:metallo-beta-lactamase family protein